MAYSNGRPPPFGAPGGVSGSDDDWGDWDPDRARRGYTGHVRALRDLDLHRDPVIDLPAPSARPASAGGLEPAALAVSAPAATGDQPYVPHRPRAPGVVQLYDSLILPPSCMP